MDKRPHPLFSSERAPLLSSKPRNEYRQNSLPSMGGMGPLYVSDYYEGQSDSEVMASRNSGLHLPLDEFSDEENFAANKVLRTGRQRKKLAARTKGGEFRLKPKKRRVYFACISKEIDLQKLHDFYEVRFTKTKLEDRPWQYTFYGDVLRLYRPARETDPIKIVSENPIDIFNMDSPELMRSDSIDPSSINAFRERKLTSEIKDEWQEPIENMTIISTLGNGSEIFVFDFGVAVFWGLSRDDEKKMLEVFRNYSVKGLVDKNEFDQAEDDMAFVASPLADIITISNDVITIPENASGKQRLAVSFAIAQSTLLAIFEARIERKIEDYKNIPEALAESGKVYFNQTQIGKMIGDVYVVRHDVNLHTEILDTPDFFWSEKLYEPDYLMVSKYLEMTERTEVLNKRLDMLRELLDVIQKQTENDHAIKLEWIVIWLILMEVAIEIFGMMSKALFGFSYK